MKIAQVWEPHAQTHVSCDKALAAVFTHTAHTYTQTFTRVTFTHRHICYIITQHEYVMQILENNCVYEAGIRSAVAHKLDIE
jgi:hypothetical protein